MLAFDTDTASGWQGWGVWGGRNGIMPTVLAKSKIASIEGAAATNPPPPLFCGGVRDPLQHTVPS